MQPQPKRETEFDLVDFDMQKYLEDQRHLLMWGLVTVVMMSLCANVAVGQVASEPFAYPIVGVIQIIALIVLVCCTIRR